jgi:hypothetical protein
VANSKHVFQSTSIFKGGRTIYLGELSWIFDCPDCEYVMTALTEDAADTIAHVHIVNMPSTHLDTLKEDMGEAFAERVKTEAGL